MDVHTCTSGICGLAHSRFADVQLFPRGNNCTSANPRCACVQVRKSRMCKPQIAYVHVRKSQLSMCARPQIADVHVMTAATYWATIRLLLAYHYNGTVKINRTENMLKCQCVASEQGVLLNHQTLDHYQTSSWYHENQ